MTACYDANDFLEEINRIVKYEGGEIEHQILYGLVGEIGEVHDLTTRSYRTSERIKDELGDCYNYLYQFTKFLDMKLEDIMDMSDTQYTSSDYVKCDMVMSALCELVQLQKKHLYYKDSRGYKNLMRPYLRFLYGYLLYTGLNNGISQREIYCYNIMKMKAKYYKRI